ncbi:CRE-SRI-71 protein [Aphelenchoides avenae]|nr:CRE-SRI-71 protein [Aphelenchus avenae]
MARVSEIVIDISFALSSLLFPVMLWLIFRHSRTLGKYRWYMLANVLFCYAFDVWLTLSKPVFLGPLLGWYLQGFVQANSFTSCVMFSVLVYLMNAMDFSIFCSLFYRWAQSYFGWFRDLFEGNRLFASYAGAALVGAALCSPLFWMGFRSDDAMRQYAANYSEFLMPLTSLNGFYAIQRTAIVEYYLLGFVFNLSGSATLGSVLYIVFALRLRSRRFLKSQSKSNYRLQMMLFRTITFQMFLGFVLLLFPALVALLLTVLNVPHSGSATTLLITAMSLHASIEFLGICYFVAPYRRSIMALTARLMKRNVARVTVASREINSSTLFTIRKDRRHTHP